MIMYLMMVAEMSLIRSPPGVCGLLFIILSISTNSKVNNKMKTSFLDYYKLILEKVSFDKSLLAKEYQKAMKSLQPDEVEEFQRWLESSNLQLKLMPNRSNKR